MNTSSPCEAIIVAEDHLELRKVISNILSDEGYLVFAAEDGNQAFEALLTTDHSCLMFLDLTMPNCDGQQLLQMIKDRPDPKPQIEVVVMSGSEEAEEFAKREQLMFLRKPVNISTILELAKDYCKPARSH